MRWSRWPVPPTRLDLPWREAEYCVLDLETTGLDLRHDAIITVGSVLIRNGRLVLSTRKYQPVRPPRAISESAMCVHGLRAQDLVSAPTIEDVADDLRHRLEGRVLVAHAAWVEQAFLSRAVPTLRRSLARHVDTAALLRAMGAAPVRSDMEPNLEASALASGVCAHTPHHALGDALTTAELFLSLASRLERRASGLTARELVEMSRQHRP